MRFEFFIAMRQLRKGRRHGFVSFIAWISILGIAVGVMALIVVLAVMSGFDQELKTKIVGVQPHITLEQVGGIEDVEGVREAIASLHIPEILSVAPFVQGQAIVRSEDYASGGFIKGVDPEHEPLELFSAHLKSGTLIFDDVEVNLKRNRKALIGRAVVGEELARRLRVRVGDLVTIISPAIDEDPVTAIRRAKSTPFVISGIFRLGMNDFDSNLILVHLEKGQELYQLGQKVTGISIRISDVDLADYLKGPIRGRVGTAYVVRSWIDLNRTFFAALRVEKTVMTILLSLIVLVAAFNIVSTLFMVVMEKTKDVGILRALGATCGSIRRIFLMQGFAVGVVGVILGAAAGLCLAFNLNSAADFLEETFGLSVFPSDIYYFDHIPAEVQWNDVTVVVTVALLMSLFAGLFPAHRAAKLDPVQALRYE